MTKNSLKPAALATVKTDGTVSFNVRAIIGVLAALGVFGGLGGGLANWSLAEDASAGVAEVVKVNTATIERNTSHLDDHDGQLDGLTARIGEIQTTQQWQVADQAASRLCLDEPEGGRSECEKRIIQWSIERLKRGKARPCPNLDCSD